MNHKKTEVAVGLFILAGFLAFSYVSVRLGAGSFFGHEYYEVYADYDSISGIKKGSSVEIAGVSVGKVGRVKLIEGRARIYLLIHSNVKLEDDVMASVRTKGLLGGKYIKITPGSSEDYLGAGAEIEETESVMDIEELIGKFIYKN